MAAANQWVYDIKEVPVFFRGQQVRNSVGEVYQRPNGTWSPTDIHFKVIDRFIKIEINNEFFNNINIPLNSLILKPDTLNGDRIEYCFLRDYPVVAEEGGLSRGRILQIISQLKTTSYNDHINFGNFEEEEEDINFEEEDVKYKGSNRYANIRQNRRQRYIPEDAESPISLDSGKNIEEGANMVNFHNELAKYKRIYSQKNFNRFAVNNNGYKTNPSTLQKIQPRNVRRYKSTSKKGTSILNCKNGSCAVMGGRRRSTRNRKYKTRKSMKRK